MAIKPTTEFINYQTPSNPINPIVDTGGYRGSPITDWFKNIVDDIVKDNTNWGAISRGEEDSSNDNSGNVPNPVAVEEPETVETETVTETPVVKKEESTVVAVATPTAETTTEVEAKTKETPVSDIVTQDVNQRNDAFINNAVGSQNAGKEPSATDWYEEDDDFQPDDKRNLPRPNLYREQQEAREANYVANTPYMPGQDPISLLVDAGKGLVGGIKNWYEGAMDHFTANQEPYTYYDGANNVTRKVVPDGLGSYDVYELYDKDNVGKYVPNPNKWTELTYVEPTFTFAGRYDGKGNPVIVTPSQINREDAVATNTTTTTTATAGNPINTPNANTPAPTTTGAPNTPTIEQAYENDEWQKAYEAGIRHSNPDNVEGRVYADDAWQQAYENGVRRGNPIGVEGRVYADDEWQKAYETGLYRGNPLGNEQFELNVDNRVEQLSDLEHHPENAGKTAEEIRTQAEQDIVSLMRKDDINNNQIANPFNPTSGPGGTYTNGSYWYEGAPDDQRVPFFGENGGNDLATEILYNTEKYPVVSGYVTDADITAQDNILHMFDNPEYSNASVLPTENGAGFSFGGAEENFSDGLLSVLATSKYGAADERRNGDNIETVNLSDEQYNQYVNELIQAIPFLAAAVANGQLTKEGIVAHFFKKNLGGKSGGSSYRGYGGYYRGGGGGGYRGGGGSSGGSSNSAGSTTQNQQRVYNIMKNWSF